MQWHSGLQLRVTRGNQSGLVVPLRERAYVLGRAISHEDVAPGRLYFHDPSVALVQALMRWDDGTHQYLVSHETDRSRSWISGIPLARGTPRRLRAGSRVKLGNLTMVIESLQDPPVSIRSQNEVVPDPDMPEWEEGMVVQPPRSPAPYSEIEAEPEQASTVEVAPEEAPPALISNGVDVTWFKTKTYQLREGERVEGPIAEFFPDGQLKRLSIFHRGKLSSVHNQLLLEHGAQVGRVISHVAECAYCDGIESITTNFEGDIDYSEEEITWEAWVRKWIDQICRGEAVCFLPESSAG